MQIGKIWFDWWTSSGVSSLSKSFLFSPKFDWSFSHLPKFNWSFCTLPKRTDFTQMFLILPKTLLKLFDWPKIEGFWNYRMIAVHSRAMSTLPSGVKKIGKTVSDFLPFYLLFCHWFGYYFALVWKIDTTSLICECSCIIYAFLPK